MLLCKKNKTIDYYKYYFDNKPPDSVRHNDNIYLSSGVSSIPIMSMYRELLSNEMMYNTEFANYVPSSGSVLLRKAIAYYERWLAGITDKSNEYFDNICINCGSTPIMAYIFDYLTEKKTEKILMVGLQYYVYEMLAGYKNIRSYLLLSAEETKTIPTVSEIQNAVENEGFKYIFLTLPMNPSGEKYTHEEFIELLEVCKKNDCVLFLDKCQWEEFEETTEEYSYNYGEDIVNTDSYENIVILDSFSKKRNIPGLRVGYVAGKKEVIDYIEYINYITCCHHPLLAIAPIVVDCYYRMLCKETDIDNRKKIKHDFRKMILSEANNEFARYLLKYVTSPQCQDDAEIFIGAILESYSKYADNYVYACERLKNAGYIVADRNGGFNFIFRYNNPYGYTEKEFKDYLLASNIYIFTQEDFCDHTDRENESFWVRITVADEIEEFRRKFDAFMECMGRLTDRSLLNTHNLINEKTG